MTQFYHFQAEESLGVVFISKLIQLRSWCEYPEMYSNDIIKFKLMITQMVV